MKIEIPRVVVPVDMSEYAPELAGQYLHVWVNPPLDKLGEHLMLAAQATLSPTSAPSPDKRGEDQLLEWYVEVWSQGPEPTHWTLEEIHDIQQQDPAFLVWMIQATTTARREHLERKKKN